MSYTCKKKIFDAVIKSKLLYSCETWLTDNLPQIGNIYMNAVKTLLGVRRQTRNDVVLIEGGFNSLKKNCKRKIIKFMEKKFKDKEKPLTKIFMLCQQSNKKGYRILMKANENRTDNILQTIKEKISADVDSSKLQTYNSLNPNLTIHKAYQLNKNCYIPDYKRVAFTKFRTSSLNLFIEKRRWSRISRENGFCRCKENKIEDEDHVLLHCAITETFTKKN